MLYEESLWFKDVIDRYVHKGALVLNIGSSTKEFIEIEQPYIKHNIIDQLTVRNCSIKNVDIKYAEGVDLVGDVTEAGFIQKLKQENASFIICSNLLEHLEDRKGFCDALTKIMNQDTILIVSVPYSFPYHEDPIDTLYRPNMIALQKSFPNLKLIEGKIVDCGFYYSYAGKNQPIIKRWVNFIKTCVAIIPTMLFNKEKYHRLAWNFKRISATCALFRLQ